MNDRKMESKSFIPGPVLQYSSCMVNEKWFISTAGEVWEGRDEFLSASKINSAEK